MENNQRIAWPGWKTVRLIGHGNFGAVYEIQRTIRGRTESAALKVIRIPKEESEIARLRADDYDDESITQYYADCLNKIEDEYALMADLKGYANIVYCDDYHSAPREGGFGWDIYIKMELLTPMKVHLGTVTSEEQVVALGIDICNALKRCEELKIVHRDIKPENIFVSKEGVYKLGDFGIAKTMEGTTGGTKTGTYDYMAPEVNNGKAYHTEVDIYSLGLVMYWLLNERTGPFLPLNGKRPTPSMKQAAWERRFAGESIPDPKHGSDALKAIVLKACAFDPKDRYQSAREMREDLVRLSSGHKFESKAEPTPDPEPEMEDPIEKPEVESSSNQCGDENETVGPVFKPVSADIEEDSNETVGPGFAPEPDNDSNELGKTVGPHFDSDTVDNREGKNVGLDFKPDTIDSENNNNSRRMPFGVLAILSVVLALVMISVGASSCWFGHKWTNATCTKAKTCSVCGSTEGTALVHNYSDATYDNPETCTNCGKTRGNVKGYKESLPGDWGPVVISVGFTNSKPWVFDEPVENCVGFTMHFRINSIEYGDIYGRWCLYAKNEYGKWEEISDFIVSDQSEVVQTLTFDDPISFTELTVSGPQYGNFKYNKSLWFSDWYLQDE